MKILITGSTGLLGPYLISAVREIGVVMTTSLSSGDQSCDLSDPKATAQLVNSTKPSVVIHAAAWTDVDGCEKNLDRAFLINRDCTDNLVRVLDPKVKFIFLSTDQVYPDSPGLHREGEEDPVNHYGLSKLEGERAALKHPNSLVFRTNFFGPSLTRGRHSLSDFIVNSLRDKKPIILFEDVLFSPLHLMTLSNLIKVAACSHLVGVFNIGSRKGVSKADFAEMIASQLGLPTTCAQRGRSTNILCRASRSLDLRLDVSRIEAALDRTMPTLLNEVLKL